MLNGKTLCVLKWQNILNNLKRQTFYEKKNSGLLWGINIEYHTVGYNLDKLPKLTNFC